MTKSGIEVKSQLVFWAVVGLRQYLNSPAPATNDPDLGECVTIRTLMFCRIFEEFQDLNVVHVDG